MKRNDQIRWKQIFFPQLSHYTKIPCFKFYALDSEFGKGVNFLDGHSL